jgi:hypothetical protein
MGLVAAAALTAGYLIYKYAKTPAETTPQVKEESSDNYANLPKDKPADVKEEQVEAKKYTPLELRER